MSLSSLLAGEAATAAIAKVLYAPLPEPAPSDLDPDVSSLSEQIVPGPNGDIYVRTYGQQRTRTPVIVLHGGPAAGHRYMRPYARLAEDRRTIFYDQSGCGRSARPADLSYYSVASYISELEAVRDWSGAAKVILLGHSWGGMLALAYAAAYPNRVAALVLAGTAARLADYEAAAQHWLAEMGPDAVAIAATEGKVGGTSTARFQALQETYYHQHLLRLASWPDWFTAVMEEAAANPVYRYLNGPSEFRFTGALSSVDLTSTLGSVRVPTLITCGQYDEAPPWIGATLATHIRGAHLHTWPGLSHMAHIEAPQIVVPTTARFLRTVDHAL